MSAVTSSPTSQKMTAHRTQAVTVMDAKAPLLRIIHLDTAGGGDCSVFIGTDSFIVIDGGKARTGRRLAVLMEHLISKEKKKLDRCIVSHYDTDHYGGLFSALLLLSSELLPTLKIVSPVGQRYVHADRTNKEGVVDTRSSADREADRVSSVGCAIEAVRKKHPHARFVDPGTFALDGWNVKLWKAGGLGDITQAAAEENNASSLMWLFSHGETGTTYYTGGDSECGPVPATIMKLDHHGSDTRRCNANLKKCGAAKVAILMGPGFGHNHPAPDVLSELNRLKLLMVATHYHFNDWKHGEQKELVSRKDENWGDIGISIHAGETFVIDVGAGVAITQAGDPANKTDKVIAKWLASTRGCQPGPEIVERCDRGAERVRAPHPCKLADAGNCSGVIEEYEAVGDFGGGYACDTHRPTCVAAMLQEHVNRKEKRKKELISRKKKERERDEKDDDFEPDDGYDEDEDMEENDEEAQSDQDSEEDDEKSAKRRKKDTAGDSGQ